MSEKPRRTRKVTSAWFAARSPHGRVLERKTCRFPDTMTYRNLFTTYSSDFERSGVKRRLRRTLVLDILRDHEKRHAFFDMRGKVHHQQGSVAMRADLERR